MQWLIDGYNLMHASGAAGDPGSSAETFRRRRRRFLNELAARLGSQRARETTIVFDAKSPPTDFPLESTYQGLQVIFALGDENADARIEELIAAHSAPKALTVVSSDRRVRQAASRRRARALTSDEFLDRLDRLRPEPAAGTPDARSSPGQAIDRDQPLSASERAYWVAEFREVEQLPEAREAVSPDAPLLTDADIARIRREVEREP